MKVPIVLLVMTFAQVASAATLAEQEADRVLDSPSLIGFFRASWRNDRAVDEEVDSLYRLFTEALTDPAARSNAPLSAKVERALLKTIDTYDSILSLRAIHEREYAETYPEFNLESMSSAEIAEKIELIPENVRDAYFRLGDFFRGGVVSRQNRVEPVLDFAAALFDRRSASALAMIYLKEAFASYERAHPESSQRDLIHVRLFMMISDIISGPWRPGAAVENSFDAEGLKTPDQLAHFVSNYVRYLSFLGDSDSKRELRWLAGYLKYKLENSRDLRISMDYITELRTAVEGLYAEAQGALEQAVRSSSPLENARYLKDIAGESCQNILHNLKERRGLSFQPHYY